MPAPCPNAGLSPRELVEAATTRTLTSFLALYGDALILLVRIGPSDSELAIGLTSQRDGSASAAEPMQFHTVVSTRQDTQNAQTRTRPEDPEALVQLLREGHYFAVPLRKREESDAMSSERISVGRARNKDLVLRHASVSKFHAWFHTEPNGEFRLTDAGSKNLTRVNGEPLPPREQKRVEPGDRLRFGSVECAVCSAEVLWSATRAFNSSSH